MRFSSTARSARYSPQRKHPEQGSFMDLLQESGAQHNCNHDGVAGYSRCQIRFRSVSRSFVDATPAVVVPQSHRNCQPSYYWRDRKEIRVCANDAPDAAGAL
jgi:hypothetical protein